jgi:hypothetical protein
MATQQVHEKLSNEYLGELLGFDYGPQFYEADDQDPLGHDAVLEGMCLLASHTPINNRIEQDTVVMGIKHMGYQRSTALLILSYLGRLVK